MVAVVVRKYTDTEISEAKERTPLSSLITGSVTLRDLKNGEYVGCCPFHDDKTPSFYVMDYKGFYHCFGCGKSGDHIGWLQERHGLSFPEAATNLMEQGGIIPGSNIVPHPRSTKARPKYMDLLWHPIVPVPNDAPEIDIRAGRIFNPKRAHSDDPRDHWMRINATRKYTYRGLNGELLGYVLRYDLLNGVKFTPQVAYCEGPNGERRWSSAGFADPRPLYGLDRLAQRPDAPVYLVEGEKCADALQAMVRKAAVLSWPGGTNGIHKVDWSPLAGRKLFIWPDADTPGMKAAEGYWPKDADRPKPGVAQYAAAAGAASVRIIDLDACGFVPPKAGWDCADAIEAGWDRERLSAWLKERTRDARDPDPSDPVENRSAPLPTDSPPPPDDADDNRGPDYDYEADVQALEGDAADPDAPLPLGFAENRFYFLSKRTRQIVALRAEALSKAGALREIARIQYFERGFQGRQGCDWGAAAEALIQACINRGPFDSNRIRGRGAWLEDDGQVVVHVGDRLIVDGAATPLADHPSRYVYPLDVPMDAPAEQPLRNAEAAQYLDLCDRLSWERSINGRLLAGWAVLAPVCGALDWRPSIWLTGPSGSGKGWILTNVLRPALGDGWHHASEGDTTAAGIRQALGADALPFVFDEAEGEDQAAMARLKDVLFLVRVAASNTGGRVYKGTTDGSGRSAVTRTCLCFASINMSTRERADEGRITPLVLTAAPAGEAAENHFAETEVIARTLFEDGTFPARLRARTLGLLPTIRANARTFAQAAAVVLGSRRIGDQIGALLAGAYSLTSRRMIDPDAAEAWLSARMADWERVTIRATETDEQRVLAHLYQYHIQISRPGGNPYRRTIGELIEKVAGQTDIDGEREYPADDADLRRNGIRVTRQTDDACNVITGFYIAHTSNPIRRIYAHTPWVNKLGEALRRVDGVVAPVRENGRPRDIRIFQGGGLSSAVWVPFDLSEGGDG